MSNSEDKLIIEAVTQHNKMAAELQVSANKLTAAAKMITSCFEAGGRVYICGNGGSAADAQHIAGELIGRFRRERAALPAIALSTDTSVITSVANDYTFEQIFARQMQALAGPKDILWAISTSGTSANVLAAARVAREKGAKILAFTGRTESELEELADVCVCTPAATSDRSQEIHQLAYHIICQLVENHFCSGKQ